MKTKSTPLQGTPALLQVPSDVGQKPNVQGKAKLEAQGSIRMGGLEAKVQAGDPKAGLESQIQARSKGADKVYSMAPAELTELLVKEILNAFEFAGTLKSALTAFGGARVSPSHPFFEVGKQWGESVFLANLFAASPEMGIRAIASGKFSTEASTAVQAVVTGLGVGQHGPTAFGAALAAVGGLGTPDSVTAAMALLDSQAQGGDDRKKNLQKALIRSGAGPGMMEAVAIGYVEARKLFQELFPEAPKSLLEGLETQGSRIVLPFEQETSPFIEKLMNFVHFLPRRLALTEQTPGFIVFPGGFGTNNEAFEVLRAGRPVHFESSAFYKPIVDALLDGWEKRGLVDDATKKLITVGDGAAEGLPKVLQTALDAPEVAAPSKERAETMAADLIRGMTTLTQLDPAVTFMGGMALKADDPAVKVGARIAGKIAKEGAPIRLGGSAPMHAEVAQAAAKANKKADIQGIFKDGPELAAQTVDKRISVKETVASDPIHKVLLYENADAFVVLPGGKGTFDELWEIACLMQTGKTPKRPIVLVDDQFWGPIMDAMNQAMAMGDQKMIAPLDMKLFTLVKTSGKVQAEDAKKSYNVMDEAGATALIKMQRAERENA